MDRRDFLIASLGVSAVLASRKASAQTSGTRAAVVIGVDQAGTLPRLQAVDGANAIADWLESEGFEVNRFVDATEKVRQSEIYESISGIVKRGTIEMLVLYFAGHGYMSSASTEWWMLSDAPDNPNEAISVIETVAQAKLCGIPNVVIISDACRSTPESLHAGNVRGVLVFPNLSGPRSGRVSIDRFSATSAGDSAFELPVSESVAKGYQGIFTGSLLDAFKFPDDEMIKLLADGTKVVPNRLLSGYLEREVGKRAQKKSIMLNQIPDIDVTSAENIYMGKARGRSATLMLRDTIRPTTIVDFALKDVGATFSNGELQSLGPAGLTTADVENKSFETGFTYLRESVVDTSPPEGFEFETGFVIRGASATFYPAVERVRILEPKMPLGPAETVGGALVGIDMPANGSPALIVGRFSDGSGTVLTALRGFVGTVLVGEDATISNISYSPSPSSPFAEAYSANEFRIKRLQGVYSAATSFGSLTIKGPLESRLERARAMARDIQYGTVPDITLALYASYTLWLADAEEELQQVREAIEKIAGPIFDLRMLTGREVSQFEGSVIPLLTGGWDLIRVLGSSSKLTDSLRPHLKRSVWTAFEKPGIDLLLAAMQFTPQQP